MYQRIRRWLSDLSDLFWDIVLIPVPPARVESQEARVIIQIIPHPSLDVESPLEPVVERIRSIEDAISDERRHGPIPDVEILSVGTPVYVPLQNRLFIHGKLTKPLPFVTSDSEPFYSDANGRSDAAAELRDQPSQAGIKNPSDESPIAPHRILESQLSQDSGRKEDKPS